MWLLSTLLQQSDQATLEPSHVDVTKVFDTVKSGDAFPNPPAVADTAFDVQGIPEILENGSF